MKRITIISIIVISILSIANLLQPFQKAVACTPWDSNYNIATGECDLPPSGESPVTGYECSGREYRNGTWYLYPNGTYQINCEWSVVGTCTPHECEF